MRLWLTGAAVAALSLTGIGMAQASQIFDTTASTCTGINCSSTVIGGTVNGFNSTHGSWTAEIFAPAGACLRLQNLSQGADLEIVAVAPDGSVFRNDDGGVAPCTLCSLVKINNTRNGWYSVSVNQFAGTAVQANFNLAFGQYNANNPNCATPTVPVSAPAAASGKAGGASPRPDGGPGL